MSKNEKLLTYFLLTLLVVVIAVLIKLSHYIYVQNYSYSESATFTTKGNAVQLAKICNKTSGVITTVTSSYSGEIERVRCTAYVHK